MTLLIASNAFCCSDSHLTPDLRSLLRGSDSSDKTGLFLTDLTRHHLNGFPPNLITG